MYTLMLLEGNGLVDMKYPDRLSDAIEIAHRCERGNSFIITGENLHLIGVLHGNKIIWRRGS